MKQQIAKKNQTDRQETAQRASQLQTPSRRSISLSLQSQRITESNHGFMRHNGTNVHHVTLKPREDLGRPPVYENDTVNTPHLEAYIAREQKHGHPLQKNMLGKMQKLFGRDFGDVRMHTDNGAREACKSLSVNAFTVGNHIFSRSLAPDRVLIAHELTHVVQQEKGRVESRKGRKTKRPDPAEQEAIQVAYAVARHQPLPEISQEIFTSTIAGEWGPTREIAQPDWVPSAGFGPDVVLRVQVEPGAGYIRFQFYDSGTDRYYMPPISESPSEIEELVGFQTIASIETLLGISIGEFYELDWEGFWIVYRLEDVDESTLMEAGLINPPQAEIVSQRGTERTEGEPRAGELYLQIGYLQEQLEAHPRRAQAIELEQRLHSLQREMREVEARQREEYRMQGARELAREVTEIQRAQEEERMQRQRLARYIAPGRWVSGGEGWRFQSGRLRLLGVPREESLEQAPRGRIESREPPTIIDEPISERADPEAFLVGQFRDILQDWHRGSGQGTRGFADRVLASLGTVDTELFLRRLIGNIIWAAAAFASENIILAFAISIFGISVNMSRDWPNVETVRDEDSVRRMIRRYFDHVYSALSDAIPQITRRFIETHPPTVTTRFAKEVFLFRNFDWDVIDLQGDPNVDPGLVADKVEQEADELLATYQRLQALGSRYYPSASAIDRSLPIVVAEVRERVKWIIYPNGARVLALVEEHWTRHVASRDVFSYRFLRFIPLQLRRLAQEREQGRGGAVGEIRSDELAGVPPLPLASEYLREPL